MLEDACGLTGLLPPHEKILPISRKVWNATGLYSAQINLRLQQAGDWAGIC